MKKKYNILKRGNFYFPYLDIKKKFVVENIVDITIKGKNVKLMGNILKLKNIIHLSSVADIIWESINKQLKEDLKLYKNCWFVPTMIHKYGKEYMCSIDILRKA